MGVCADGSATLSGLRRLVLVVTQGSALARATLGWNLLTPSALRSVTFHLLVTFTPELICESTFEEIRLQFNL
jgi:hypothetical protein